MASHLLSLNFLSPQDNEQPPLAGFCERRTGSSPALGLPGSSVSALSGQGQGTWQTHAPALGAHEGNAAAPSHPGLL